jgi:hypothetical protein
MKPKVFLSSTCFDLWDLRAELRRYLDQHDFEVWASDDFGSPFSVDPTTDTVSTCLENVERCTAVVLVIDRRYGRPIESGPWRTMSPTEAEIRHAWNKNVPVYAFIRQEAYVDFQQLPKDDSDVLKISPAWLTETGERLVLWRKFVEAVMDRPVEPGRSNWIDQFHSSVDLKLHVLKRLREKLTKPGVRSLFDLVEQRCPKIRFFPINPPISASDRRLSIVIREHQRFQFAAQDLESIIRELVKHGDAEESVLRERAEEYAFVKRDVPGGQGGALEQYRLLRHLTADDQAFEGVRREVLIDLLLKRNGLYFNDVSYGVLRFSIGANPAQEREWHIELQPSDYYTYKVLAKLAQLRPINGDYPLASFMPDGFQEYVATSLQKNVHFGFGIAIALRTLRDNKLVVTRRSHLAAADAGEGGLLFMSANEGIGKMDKDLNNPQQLTALRRIVERALEEELVGRHRDSFPLCDRIKECSVTGVLTYLPNQIINLAVYVAADCYLEDIVHGYRYARDRGLETIEFGRGRSVSADDHPLFSSDELSEYIIETIGKHEPGQVWDEGALATIVLSTLAE